MTTRFVSKNPCARETIDARRIFARIGGAFKSATPTPRASLAKSSMTKKSGLQALQRPGIF